VEQAFGATIVHPIVVTRFACQNET